MNVCFPLDSILSIHTAYECKNLTYHNFSHISTLFQIARDEGLTLNKEQEVAILFHDVVYVIGAKDNEEKSVGFARDFLRHYSEYWDGDTEDVAQCILSTKDHIPLCENAKLVCDLDLSCFFFDFDKYVDKIYKECLIVYKPEQFLAGRLQFLKSMLEKKEIYHTKHFKKYIDKAKFNLQQELAILQRKPK